MPRFINFSNAKTSAVFDALNGGFEAFSDLMRDVAKGSELGGVTKEQANDKIRETMFSVLEVPVGTKGKDLRRAIRRHKVDVFEVIETTVEDMLTSGWGANPFFNEFVEIKNANNGDVNEFYTEDKVILTVSELSGNHWNLFRQRLGSGKSFQLKTSHLGLAIYAEYERFMSGAIDWAGFIQKVYEALDKKVNSMVYSALAGVGSELPAGGQWVKTSPLTSLTKDTFVELCEDVQTANGTDIVVMGTKVALSKITNLEDVNWISEGMKDERHTTGRVGYFEGIRLAEIPQVFADGDTTTKLVANDKLWIMPVADNKFIKIFNEGDPQMREISDGNTNVDRTLEYEYDAKIGVGVVIGRLFGIWNITSSVSA